jgi:tripartite-type tricarboxylate transporter receptor subunit TctC
MRKPAGMLRRTLLGTAMALPALVSPALAQAPWPNRPVRLIDIFSAGGATDAVLRVLAPHLQEIWGQPVVIENRAGGSGTVATEYVLRSPPDGYTLGLGALPVHVANPILKRLPFDTTAEAVVMVLIGTNRMMLVSHPSIPPRSLPEFIAYARANPGRLSYGSNGNATPQHLAMELLKIREGLDIEMVPYPRGGLIQDLLTGRIQCAFYVGPMDVIRSGGLVTLGIAGNTRSPDLPDIPNFAEQGVPEFESNGFFTLYGPRGVPGEVVAKVNAAVNQALQRPALRRALAEQQVVPRGGTPEQAVAHIRAAYAQAESVIRAAGIRAE